MIGLGEFREKAQGLVAAKQAVNSDMRRARTSRKIRKPGYWVVATWLPNTMRGLAVSTFLRNLADRACRACTRSCLRKRKSRFGMPGGFFGISVAMPLPIIMRYCEDKDVGAQARHCRASR